MKPEIRTLRTFYDRDGDVETNPDKIYLAAQTAVDAKRLKLSRLAHELELLKAEVQADALEADRLRRAALGTVPA